MPYQIGEDGAVITSKEVNASIPTQEGNMKAIKPDPAGSLQQRHAYYEEHKQEILADIEGIGDSETQRKWTIAKSTFSGMKRRWLGYDGQKSQMPVLPPFNESWVDDVKVAWLRCFQALLERAK